MTIRQQILNLMTAAQSTARTAVSRCPRCRKALDSDCQDLRAERWQPTSIRGRLVTEGDLRDMTPGELLGTLRSLVANLFCTCRRST